MSKVIEVKTMNELDKILNVHNDVVVDFAAPSWCVPCQRLAPHYEKAAELVEGTVFVHVDIDQAPDIASEFDIMSVPTVLRFRQGQYESQTVVKGRTVVQLVNELA